jgi:serine/threonine protein kinase
MPAPTTIDEFLELVRKSGVVDEKRLTTHLDKLRAAGPLPAEPVRLATLLLREGVLTHFQAEQFLQGKWRRFTIGKYKVLERLGAGGMGSVYLCEHMLMRRRVAVKVLPAAKAQDSSSLERFYREARAVAALDHPNIVRAYDIDQDDNLHFLVMEHVDGSSLQEIIKRAGAMDVIRATHYIRQAALGLQHAHETAGLVHRDIKPGNILVDRNGIVKILDMGLARFFHDEEDVLTKKYDENVLGTADYLAPEQALDSHGVDIRADIYSLGATFYFCLTGRTPFAEGSVAQKLIWHQTRAPKPVRSFRPEVPEGIVAVIDRMMAKDVSQRYQTPQETADALSPWTQTPIPPPPDNEMPQFSPAATKPETGVPSSASRPASEATSSQRNKVWQVSGSAAMQATPPLSAANTRSPGPVTPPRESNPPRTTSAASAAPVVSPRTPPTAPAGRGSAPAPPPPPAPASVSAPVRAPSAATAGGNGAVRTAQPNSRQAGAVRPAAAAPAPVAPARSPVVSAPVEVVEELDAGPFVPAETRRQRVRTSKRKPAATGWKDRRILWISLGTAAAIALLIGLLVLLLRGSDSDKSGTPKGRQPIRVGGANSETLAQALNRARRGEHIILEGDIAEYGLAVRSHLSGLTIEAAPDKTVVWKAPPGVPPDSKLLYIESATNVTIKGIHFDGYGTTEALIVLFGKCTGTHLEKLQLRNSGKYGVLFSNCEGDSDHRVVLRQLEFLTTKTMTAVRFQNLEKQQINQNRFIRLESCRFEGAGMAITREKELDVDKTTVTITPNTAITLTP